MSGRIRVFGPERRPERVDLRQRQRAELSLELARHGQVAGFAEEILCIVYLSCVVPRHVVQVERRDLKHGAGALGVAARDQRSVEIEESPVVEILVYRVGHGVADAQYGSERVRARAQVGDLAQELERMSFFLQRIGFRVGGPVQLDALGLYLDGLPRTERLDQTALDLYARSGRNLFEQAVVESGDIGHDLNVVNDRTVVDGDEGHVLISPFGPYPSFDDHVRSRRRRSEQLRDFCSAVWHISSFSSLRVIRFLHRDNKACLCHGTESGSERKYRKFNSKVVFPGSENGCRRAVRPGIGFLLLAGGATTKAPESGRFGRLDEAG